MLPIAAGRTGMDAAVQKQIGQAFDRLTDSSLKLATLTKLNRGSDNPAGLIGVEQLNQELSAATAAARSLDRTRSVVHVADSGLQEASSLLNDIQGNLVAAASDGTSAAEREALQLEVDAAIEALDRIGYSTSFGGRELLRGQSLDFVTGADLAQTVQLQLPEVSSSALGGEQGTLTDLRSGGGASLSGDLTAAAAIVKDASSTLAAARAEAGAFERYAIDSTQNVLEGTIVNLSSAISQLRDTDVAFESANLIQAQILADSSVLSARFTNSTRQTAANLLSGVFDTLA